METCVQNTHCRCMQGGGNNAHAAMRCPCAQAEAGKVVMAGAFGETPEGALFIFKDATPEVRRWGHV